MQIFGSASRSDVHIRAAGVLASEGIRIDDQHAVEFQTLGLLCTKYGYRRVESIVVVTEVFSVEKFSKCGESRIGSDDGGATIDRTGFSCVGGKLCQPDGDHANIRAVADRRQGWGITASAAE